MIQIEPARNTIQNLPYNKNGKCLLLTWNPLLFYLSPMNSYTDFYEAGCSEILEYESGNSIYSCICRYVLCHTDRDIFPPTSILKFDSSRYAQIDLENYGTHRTMLFITMVDAHAS